MKIEIIQFLKSAAGSNLNFWQFLGLENDYRICCVRSSFTSCCDRVGGFPLRKSFRRRTSLRNLSGQRFVLSRPCRNGLPFQRETEPDKLFWWRKNSLSSTGARWATISLNESINFENDWRIFVLGVERKSDDLISHPAKIVEWETDTEERIREAAQEMAEKCHRWMQNSTHPGKNT